DSSTELALLDTSRARHRDRTVTLCARLESRAMADPYAAYPSLEFDRPAPHVLRVTLRTPGRLNAVGSAMHGELAGVWRTIGDDDETRAVVVRGADGAFSAGGDLDL